MRNVYVYNVERGLPSDITGKYDVIILSHVLEHICYPQQLLKDIHKILNPGGFLIIALPNLMHFRSRWQLMKGNFEYQEYGIWDYTHFRWYTYKSGKKLLEDAGYKVEKSDVSGEIPFEPKLKKVIPEGPRKGMYRFLKKISPGLFGFNCSIWPVLLVNRNPLTLLDSRQLLPIACCQLTSCWLLVATIPRVANCLLAIAYCQLPIAN
jgi:SAM-dependent methyltransferase